LRPSLLVLSFYWLSRLAFIFKYKIHLDEIEISEVLEFLYLSFRFDLSLFFSVSLLPQILLIINNGVRIKQAERLLFTAGNGIFVLLNTIDLYFFAFNGRRTDWPALRFLLENAIRQVPQLTLNYPMVPMLAVGSTPASGFPGLCRNLLPESLCKRADIKPWPVCSISGTDFWTAGFFAEQPFHHHRK